MFLLQVLGDGGTQIAEVIHNGDGVVSQDDGGCWAVRFLKSTIISTVFWVVSTRLLPGRQMFRLHPLGRLFSSEMSPITVMSSANLISFTDWLEVELFEYKEKTRGERTQPQRELVLMVRESEKHYHQYLLLFLL